MSKPRIAFLSTDWGQNEYRKLNNKPGAISQYRLVHPMRYLSEYYDITFLGSDFVEASKGQKPEDFYKDFFEEYDLIVSKVMDSAGTASALAFFSKQTGVPLVIDIDDNIWEVKSDQPGHKQYFKGSQKLGIASAFISYASAVFTSTKPLADYIRNRLLGTHEIMMDTYVLPNCMDPIDYSFTPVKKDPKKTVIGWQGSTTHHNDLKVAMPSIIKLMGEYKTLHLELLGGIEADKILDLMGSLDPDIIERIKIKRGVPAYDTFPDLLSRQPWDIGIAPLTDDLFNRAKSHIKWMEYAMYEIPCVASKVYPYFEPVQGTDVITDGVNGYTALPEEWYTKLKFLIDNKQERLRVGKEAKKYVSDKWHIKNHVSKWRDAIDRVLSK